MVFSLMLLINLKAEAIIPNTDFAFEAHKPEIIREINEIIPERNTITYTSVPRGIILSIVQFEIFDEKTGRISENGKFLLSKIAQLLKGFNNKCTIEAHLQSDIINNKYNFDNWELSIIKANSIADYMIKEGKIDGDRIFAVGFGEFMPFKDNVSRKNFPNDRIDFVIFDYEVSR